MGETGDRPQKRLNVVTHAEQDGEGHGETGRAVDEHTDQDGLGYHDRWVMCLLGHVERSICTNKGKDVTNHADHKGQSLRRPQAVICKRSKDGFSVSMRRQDDKRNENSKESQNVKNQNQTLEFGKSRRNNGVDKDGEEDDGPVKQSSMPRLRRVGVICCRHANHAHEHVASEETTRRNGTLPSSNGEPTCEVADEFRA